MADEKQEGQTRRRIDPLIYGLLSRLPKPGELWTEAARKEWLETLEANLKLVYPNGPIKPGQPGGPAHAQPTPGTVRST